MPCFRGSAVLSHGRRRRPAIGSHAGPRTWRIGALSSRSPIDLPPDHGGTLGRGSGSGLPVDAINGKQDRRTNGHDDSPVDDGARLAGGDLRSQPKGATLTSALAARPARRHLSNAANRSGRPLDRTVAPVHFDCVDRRPRAPQCGTAPVMIESAGALASLDRRGTLPRSGLIPRAGSRAAMCRRSPRSLSSCCHRPSQLIERAQGGDCWSGDTFRGGLSVLHGDGTDVHCRLMVGLSEDREPV